MKKLSQIIIDYSIYKTQYDLRFSDFNSNVTTEHLKIIHSLLISDIKKSGLEKHFEFSDKENGSLEIKML